MFFRISNILLLLLVNLSSAIPQNVNTTTSFVGVVYDENLKPVPYTHVISRLTGIADVTDTLGIFILRVLPRDQLSFYNLAYHDTTVNIDTSYTGFYLKLKRKRYPLKEAKIFNWGSTYEDLLNEVERQGVPDDLGEQLGLPSQDPDLIPFEMDEKKIKSPGFLIMSPVSFLYYNLSRKAKGARRAFKLEQDRELLERFRKVISKDNISDITGLAGEELEAFIIFLNMRMSCDHKCDEFELLSEIHSVWKIYQENNKIVQ
ncbi:MAG: hypothetical protein K9J30_08750 [Bacteroidales bacterium]|nr:hypothetical protein [Bacteroidales bacterium]